MYKNRLQLKIQLTRRKIKQVLKIFPKYGKNRFAGQSISNKALKISFSGEISKEYRKMSEISKNVLKLKSCIKKRDLKVSKSTLSASLPKRVFQRVDFTIRRAFSN